MPDVNDLRGKTVLITGGARRLGRAMALAAAKQGARVAFTYLSSKDAAGQMVDQIKNSGAEGFAIVCDLRSEESIRAAVAAVLDKFGGIDVLINNAGIFKTTKFDEI